MLSSLFLVFYSKHSHVTNRQLVSLLIVCSFHVADSFTKATETNNKIDLPTVSVFSIFQNSLIYLHPLYHKNTSVS